MFALAGGDGNDCAADAITDGSVEPLGVPRSDADGVFAHAADATSTRAAKCAFMVIGL